ncbi:MAG: peptidase M23 [Dethiosulfovibrio peptidovorans]|nr:MAG: peptidase M23 [Dethiosulfovibrio peptidovorans]
MIDNRRWLLCGVSLFSLLLLFFAGVASGGITMEELDRKIREEEHHMGILKRQILRQQTLIKASKKMEAGYLRELARFDQKRQVAAQSVSLLNLKRKKLLLEISTMEKSIAKLEEKRKKLKFFLGERLVAIYKFGGMAELNLLLSSQNVIDAMNTGYLLQKLAIQDESLIRSVERESQRIEGLVEGLSMREKDLLAKKKALAVQKKKLEAAVIKRNNLLAQLRGNRKAYIISMKEAEADQREVQRKIKEYVKAKARLTNKGRPSSPKTPPLPAHKGRFRWPLRGKITSRFGYRVHPKFKTKTMHTGIDVSAPRGTAVHAAATGDVLYAGWLRGYGQIVILDHGGGFSTVYAHLSRILVSEGQRISEGKVVGNVGDTGVTTGPHLHFEVRVNGNAKNPLKYL